MFNRHANVAHLDQFPMSFEPWNRYAALIMDDVKDGTKVKHAIGKLKSTVSDFSTVVDGSNPTELQRGTTFHTTNLHNRLHEGNTFQEGEKDKGLDKGVYFYDKFIGEVVEQLNPKLIISTENLKDWVSGEMVKQGAVGVEELFKIMPQHGYNQYMDIVELLFNNGELDPVDRLMKIQYGGKVLDMAKAEYVKSVLGSDLDTQTEAVKVAVVNLGGESKLESADEGKSVLIGELDALSDFKSIDMAVLERLINRTVVTQTVLGDMDSKSVETFAVNGLGELVGLANPTNNLNIFYSDFVKYDDSETIPTIVADLVKVVSTDTGLEYGRNPNELSFSTHSIRSIGVVDYPKITDGVGINSGFIIHVDESEHKITGQTQPIPQESSVVITSGISAERGDIVDSTVHKEGTAFTVDFVVGNIGDITDVEVEGFYYGDHYSSSVDVELGNTDVTNLVDNTSDIVLDGGDYGDREEVTYDIEVYDNIGGEREEVTLNTSVDKYRPVHKTVTDSETHMENMYTVSNKGFDVDVKTDFIESFHAIEEVVKVLLDEVHVAETKEVVSDLVEETLEDFTVTELTQDLEINGLKETTLNDGELDVTLDSYHKFDFINSDITAEVGLDEDGVKFKQLDVYVQATRLFNIVGSNLNVELTDVTETVSRNAFKEIELGWQNTGIVERSQDVGIVDTEGGVTLNGKSVSVEYPDIAEVSLSVDIELLSQDKSDTQATSTVVLGGIEEIGSSKSDEDVDILFTEITKSLTTVDVALIESNSAEDNKAVEVVADDIIEKGFSSIELNVAVESRKHANVVNTSDDVTIISTETVNVVNDFEVGLENYSLAGSAKSIDVRVEGYDKGLADYIADVELGNQDKAAVEESVDISLDRGSQATVEIGKDVLVDVVESGIYETGAEVSVDSHVRVDSEITFDTTIERGSYADSSNLSEMVLEIGDLATNEGVSDFSIDDEEQASEKQGTTEVEVSATDRANIEQVFDISLEGSQLADIFITTDVEVDTDDLAVLESETEVDVERTSNATTEYDVEIDVGEGDLANSSDTLDTSIEEYDLSDNSLVVEVSVEDITLSDSFTVSDVVIDEIDLADTESKADVVVEDGYDYAITENEYNVVIETGDTTDSDNTTEVEISKPELATSSTFIDVVVNDSEPFSRGRKRLVDILEEDESNKSSENYMDLVDDEEGRKVRDALLEIYEENEVSKSSSTIMLVDEETHAQSTPTSIIAIEEDDLLDKISSKVFTVDGDDKGDRINVLDGVVEVDGTGHRERIFVGEREEEDEGNRLERVYPIDVDDDDLGVGKLPVDPPWEEPETKGKVWLIMGKQYPAWNGWNPKKTR